MRALALSVLLVLGCGGASSEGGAGETTVASAPAPASDEATPEPAPPAVSGAIARAELLPVLEVGLARFLQGVEMDTITENGKFVGFRLKRLWPEDARFRKADLLPGDVVTRINGQPIERPEQAHRVWDSLRVASELLIEYRRNGEARELRFAIVD